MSEKIIEVKSLCKKYNMTKSPRKKISGALFGYSEIFADDELYSALDGISFCVEKGECVGIVGKNGSGKSTLLKILTGVSKESSGSFSINGSVASLLELGVGFNLEYTGLENIYLNGTVYGFTKSEVTKKIDEILDFAEISREVAKQPLKTYSSGMSLRLAFSLMMSLDSDVILVDEALAVGDYHFQSKCFNKFEELKSNGKTILLVSHDVETVRRFCSRAIMLDAGKIVADGDVAITTSLYMESCVSADKSPTFQSQSGMLNHYGTHKGSIKKISISQNGIIPLGEIVEIELEILIKSDIDLNGLGISISIKDKFGLDLSVFQTETEFKHGLNNIVIRFKNQFTAGEYFLAIGLEDKSVAPISYYEYIEGVEKIKSVTDTNVFGLIKIPCEINMR